MSIRYSGAASRSFIIGSSEWPPASRRASGPSSSSSSSACDTLVARSYSNAAGTCIGPPRAPRRPGRAAPALSPRIATLAVVRWPCQADLRDRLAQEIAVTLAQLQSFVLVARLGSVKAAAAELHVTEPAVSVAVSALRKELGHELFVRTGRGIALTPGGWPRWPGRSSRSPSRPAAPWPS